MKGVKLNLPSIASGSLEAIVHALNRLGYGPRPGDVEEVRRMGLAAWIEGQLQPEKLNDTMVDRRLSRYPVLEMNPLQVLREFPPRQLVEATRKLSQRLDPPKDPRIDAGDPSRMLKELRQAKLVRAIYSERQLLEVMTDFWFNHFNVYANKGAGRWWIASYERDAIRPHALGKFRDLLGATARHPSMLVYLDNWLSAAPGSRAYGLAIRTPTAQRAKELGLPPGGIPMRILQERGLETAKLESAVQARNQGRAKADARRVSNPELDDPSGRRGLNENYARELLELHTLGVDGGYTQADIVEVARAFTGWTLVHRAAGQGFVFLDEWHDRGPKTVMGRPLERKGIGEGEEVLDRLAAHPTTARFICTKLARRLVRDDPPPKLVDRMARSFLKSDGDIRAVLISMLNAPNFWDADSVGAKVKSPLEYAVSMARAANAKINPLPKPESKSKQMGGMDLDANAGAASDANPKSQKRLPAPALDRFIRNMGQSLYLAKPPTGFGDVAQSWISAGSMLDRFKVAIRFASNRLAGVEIRFPDSVARAKGEEELVQRLGDWILGREISPDLRAALVEQLQGLPKRQGGSGRARLRLALGWLLSSPEFQRR